jgi:GT2 family glycosyltransferase
LTYKTNREILSNCLNSIDQKVKIKIIENSENFENEKEFINKYANLSIECTGKNLGFGGGHNFGFLQTDTKFALMLSPDTICEKNFFENIKLYIKSDLEFSLIGISFYKNEPYQTYGYFNKPRKKETNTDSLVDVDWIAGCAMLINLDKYENKKIFDENIFIYFEDFDVCSQTIKNGGKVFSSKLLLIEHLGNKGSIAADPNFKDIAQKFKDWHWTWSQFYFYKKNYSYLYALRKCFFKLVKSFLRMFFYKLLKNSIAYNNSKYRFLVLLNSMIGKKSYYRIKD